MGADFAVAPDSPELKSILEKQKLGFDVVIDAVGHENIINAGISMIKMTGTICVYGVVGSPEINLKKDKGPYNFNLLIHQWPTRHAEASAQEPLIDWIREGLLNADDFVTGVFPIEQFSEAVEAVKLPGSIKTMLTFDSWSRSS
ncbi:MAG: zinc-binding dehydrogenase [Oceanispirochaeta sp.]|jgi:threonine dehydrogenase-like Zn-dependent dehydrogenase|nr:zinc-binding dehydrogenase [Oceanispirochaeta sp.]